MYGAIIGDIVGSRYEFGNFKSKDFPLFQKGCDYTDDTIMTVAVAEALLRARAEQVSFREVLVEEMQGYGRMYPHPQGAYGGRFAAWLQAKDPQPYNSFGNGSAMRVSPCGLIAVTLEEALELAKVSAEVTHNHPEGIKGAQATAAAVYLARAGPPGRRSGNTSGSISTRWIRPWTSFAPLTALMKAARGQSPRPSRHFWNPPASRMPSAMQSPWAATAIPSVPSQVPLPGASTGAGPGACRFPGI